ncbi:MAG: Sec-independent protein translocase protein TatB [Pseudomonadota bacterium]
MFDFSFSELTVVMVVALIVIGPERLPKVARTLGHLWGRAQRYVNGVKADIERDMAVEEFRQLQQKVQSEANAVEKSFQEAAQTADQQAQEINEAVAKLSSPNDTDQSGQAVQRPEQSVGSPPAIPTAKNSE